MLQDLQQGVFRLVTGLNKPSSLKSQYIYEDTYSPYLFTLSQCPQRLQDVYRTLELTVLIHTLYPMRRCRLVLSSSAFVRNQTT